MATYTEEEARKKWCPHSRLVIDSEGFASGNRFDHAPPKFEEACRCFASECMAWRRVPVKRSAHERGFCGLAGSV